MFMVSDRAKNNALNLLLVAVIVLFAVSVGFAAESAHHPDSSAQLKDFGWRVLNFALLAAILGWAIKKANVKGSLSDRQIQIEKSLRDAQEAKEAAEAKLLEYNSKLEKAAKEIDGIRIAIISEGELEKTRIIAEAKIAAEKIVAQAAQSAEHETMKAREALRAEAGRLAVELASGKLTGAVQKRDHDRFVGEYLDKVVKL
jgi:F-type H+-transporting ATPase subunit b